MCHKRDEDENMEGRGIYHVFVVFVLNVRINGIDFTFFPFASIFILLLFMAALQNKLWNPRALTKKKFEEINK